MCVIGVVSCLVTVNIVLWLQLNGYSIYINVCIRIILLLSVLVTWSQLPDDGSTAEIYRSQIRVKYIIVELLVLWGFVNHLQCTE